MCTLSKIDKLTCVPNPGGGLRLFLLSADNFSADFPSRADLLDGLVNTIPLKPNVAAVEVEVNTNSLAEAVTLKGAGGFQTWEHGVTAKLAGYNKEQVNGFELLKNAGVVAFLQIWEGEYLVLGTSANPLAAEITHTTGAKPSDAREWTLNFKGEGYTHAAPYIASGVFVPA